MGMDWKYTTRIELSKKESRADSEERREHGNLMLIQSSWQAVASNPEAGSVNGR